MDLPDSVGRGHRISPTRDGLSVVGARVVDLGLVVGVAIVGFFDVLASDDGSTWLPVVTMGLCGIAVVTVALRRRWPLPSFAVMVAVVLVNTFMRASLLEGYWTPFFAPVASLSALATPVIRRQPARRAAVAGVTGALAITSLVVPAGDVYTFLLYVTLLAGTYAAGVGIGIYLRDLDRQRLVAAEEARLDERMDLARELHDLVAHYVTGIVVQAQAAQVVSDRDPAATRTALHQIEHAGKEALTAMRGLVGSLRDDRGVNAGPLTPPTGLAGISDLAANSESLGFPVTVSIGDGAAAVPGAVAASTHRLVQEALSNVRRHAKNPTTVTVDLQVVDDVLVASVTDDGLLASAAPRDHQGFGLIGMAERVETLAGTFCAGPVPAPGHGWRVQARLPLDGSRPMVRR